MEELLELVKVNWTFDVDNYARLQSEDEEDKVFNYAVNHILKHEAATLGLLASVCESSDHTGEALDKDKLKTVIRRMLIHTLSLAGLLELSAEDLKEEIEEWAKKVQGS